MVAGEGQFGRGPLLQLTPQQQRARRLRNIAIGVSLAALVIAFYSATIVKFGPKLMDRPIINVNTK